MSSKAATGLEHARLAPSSASRWIACPGSVEAESEFPDNAGVHAEEGTAAHALAEHCLTQGVDAAEADTLPEWERFDSTEFREHVQTYLDYCRALPGEHLVEVEFDLTRWIPEGFGTSDHVAIDDKVLHVTDLKFGKGVKVSARGNPQAKIYALGAYEALRCLYDIDSVRLHISQPRLDWIDDDELPVAELLQWAEDELAPAAEQAAGTGAPRVPGDHCLFCKARAVCRERAQRNVELATEEFGELPSPDTLSPEELSQIYLRLSEFQRWAKDIEEHALNEALAGRPLPGTKLVAGRGRREWVDESLAAQALLDAGMPEKDVYVRKLTTIGACEKALGKKHEVFSQVLEKKPGKPALVGADDPRPEYQPADAAALDFNPVS